MRWPAFSLAGRAFARVLKHDRGAHVAHFGFSTIVRGLQFL